MKITDDRLAVARAVRAECTNAGNDSWNVRVRGLDLEAILAAIPEPDPLPAPTGPGAYLARLAEHAWDGVGKRWHQVEVCPADIRGDDVMMLGCPDDLWNRRDFDAWLPLVPPGGGE